MKTAANALVCVTQQKTCAHLIRSARAACGEDGTLHIIHVSKDNWNFFENIKEGEALEYLFVIAKSVGAELSILHSKDIPESIAQFAHHYQVDTVFIGETRQPGKHGFRERLEELLADSDIQVSVLPS